MFSSASDLFTQTNSHMLFVWNLSTYFFNFHFSFCFSLRIGPLNCLKNNGQTFSLEKIMFFKPKTCWADYIDSLFCIKQLFLVLLTLLYMLTTCWTHSLLTSEAFCYIFRKKVYFKRLKRDLISHQLKVNWASVVTWCPVLIYQPAQSRFPSSSHSVFTIMAV